MIRLMGEVIKEHQVIRNAEARYIDESDFFIALVTISYKLGIEVPLWTSFEDRKLQIDNEVSIEVENNCFFRVYRK